MLELGGRLLAGENLQGICEAIASLAREALRAEYACVYELLPPDEGLLLRAGSGRGERERHGTLLPLDGLNLPAAALRTCEPVLAKSALALQIAGGSERPFGVLEVQWAVPRAVRGDELTLIQSLAFALAAAAQREVASAEIERGGLHDPLTGLANRLLFNRRLHRALQSGGAREAHAVLVLGLDRFKLVNETLGHDAGDELLRAVAHRLGWELGEGQTLARIGGDQFALLAKVSDGERGALRIAHRLLGRLEQPIAIGDDREVFATATVGMAVAHDTAEAADVVRDAEVAMHHAKARGSTRVEVFERDPVQSPVDPLRIETDLRRAMSRRELRLVYQPLVSLEGSNVVGCEALLRWAHPELGLVSPAQFMPVAESNGLIVPIGAWVLEQACHRLAEWAARSESGAIPYVSVNVSARQLAEPDFSAVVERALAKSGVPSDRLTLEITETLLIEKAASPVAALQELKELGVRLVLDDFGTGYSSLGYLKHLPLDGLKLDRDFITGLEHGTHDRRIVEAIVSLAAALDLEVVAEGVETAAQAELLADMGCDLAQGFYFARPMPAPALEELLSSECEPALPAAASANEVADHAESDTITLGKAATALGVSASTLRRWTQQGRIRALRTRGGHRRFPVDEVRRLNARRAGTDRAPVRPVTPPADLAPAATSILEQSGMRLAETASRVLYRDAYEGWFASAEAREPLRRWTRAIASACRGGNYQLAAKASIALNRHAALAGASLLERHAFLEWFGEALLRMLASTGSSHNEGKVVRRLFTSLRQGLLAAADQ